MGQRDADERAVVDVLVATRERDRMGRSQPFVDRRPARKGRRH